MPTEEEKETLTFNDVIKLAEQNGLRDDMYILMIAENPTSGKVYKHGNYKPWNTWYECGETEGFA